MNALLRALGLGKDPHVEWMVDVLAAKPSEVVVNRLYEHAPRYQLWKGTAHGVPVSFYTEARNKFRGGGGLYLGKAGPQFMEGVSDYRCFFYRPSIAPTISMDEPRWPDVVSKAMGDPEWSSSFPEEAFELGVGVGRFAMELDCPLDSRPVFAHLGALRKPLDGLSDAVDRVYLYPAGVGVAFNVERLTKEKLREDVETSAVIMELASAVG